jgi:hypothetical protein
MVGMDSDLLKSTSQYVLCIATLCAKLSESKAMLSQKMQEYTARVRSVGSA